MSSDLSNYISTECIRVTALRGLLVLALILYAGCGGKQNESLPAESPLVFNVNESLLGVSDSLSVPDVHFRHPAGWLVPDADVICDLAAGIAPHPLCVGNAAENICFAAFSPDTTACLMISDVNMADTAAAWKALRDEGYWFSRPEGDVNARNSSAVFRSGKCLVRQLMVQTSTAVVFTMLLQRESIGGMVRIDFISRKQAYVTYLPVFESFIGAIVNTI